MFYTYVLQSQKDKKIYIGYTEDLKQRLLQHNSGLVKATKNRRLLKLIYFECCVNKEDAIKREKSLKTGFGKSYLKRRLKNYWGIV